MAKTSKRKRPADPEADELAREKRGQQSKPNRTPKDISAGLDIVSDNGEDPTRVESQQFLAMTKAFAKQQTPKKGDHLAEYRNHVRVQEEKLMALQKRTSEELSTYFDASKSTLQAIISASLSDSTSRNSATAAPLPADPPAASQVMNARSTTILTLCRQLLEKHDTSTRHIEDAGTTVVIGQLWKQDQQDAKDKMDMGRRAAKTQIGKLLEYSGDVTENKEGVEITMLENGVEVDLVLYMGRKSDGNGREPSKGGTWAVTAHRAEKDVRRLVRKLSTQE